SVGYIGIFVPLPTHWILIGVVLSMGAVSSLATTQSIMFAGVMTLIEVGGLVLILTAGAGQDGDVITRLPEMIPSAFDSVAWAAIGGTTLIAVFAFIGFEHLVNIAEELKEPNHTLPR